MQQTLFSNKFTVALALGVVTLGGVSVCVPYGVSSSFAQDFADDPLAGDSLTGDPLMDELRSFGGEGAAADDLPLPAGDVFEFDDAGVEATPEVIQDKIREGAFDSAVKTLLPLRPGEIRELLERFDRTVESTELPVRPYPRPEMVVQNVSLDPGAMPLTVKLAFGYVTTLSVVDSSGDPWMIEDVSWVGNFVIEESTVTSQTNILRISPDSKFAHGNISMRLKGLNAPVIFTLETGQDFVHYRIDAVIPKKNPNGTSTPIIDPGVTLRSGDPDMSVALVGVIPDGAEWLEVSGADGRTSAYIYNGLTYLRTPLSLLSPAWDSSVTSADGTKVYALEETPVVLLSDKGRMVRAYLNKREELLNE